MFKTSKERLDACGINSKKNYRTLAMLLTHNVNSLRIDDACKQYLNSKVDTLLSLDKQGFECKAMCEQLILSDDAKDKVLELCLLKHSQVRYENIVCNTINPDIVKALIA